MGRILTRTPWRTRSHRSPSIRPRGPLVVNWDSPQAYGLKGLWTVSRGSGLVAYDLLRVQNGVITTVWIKDAEMGPVLNRNDGTVNVLMASPTVSSFPITVVCWVKLDATTDERIWQIADAGSATAYIMFVADGGRGWEYQFRNGTGFDSDGFSVANGGTLDSTAWHCVVCSSASATSHKIWVDGVLLEEDTNNTTFPAVTNQAFLGESDQAPSEACQASIAHWAVYDTAWNDALAYHAYSPRSRWDIYHELGRVFYSTL